MKDKEFDKAIREKLDNVEINISKKDSKRLLSSFMKAMRNMVVNDKDLKKHENKFDFFE